MTPPSMEEPKIHSHAVVLRPLAVRSSLKRLFAYECPMTKPIVLIQPSPHHHQQALVSKNHRSQATASMREAEHRSPCTVQALQHTACTGPSCQLYVKPPAN